MSVAVLTQVYDEMRRLAIAGGSLASGDFRLKKLVPPLTASAAKAPVFGKVAEAIEKVIDGSNKDPSDALLELSTLVSAVLYTQGETGIEGKLAPIPTTDFGLPSSNASARMLKPLIESLTTTGSGREEIIKDAQQRGAFKDLRLVRLAVAALDDPYAPIADFIAAEVLPIYGTAIYNDLQTAFDPKAKGGAVRRLKLMHRLDPEKTREHVQEALDSGSVDMKVAAIECLAGSKEALPFLLEQAKAKSNDVRRAALGAMAELSDDSVVDSLIKAISGNDLLLAALPASRNRSPKLLSFLLKEAESRLAALFTATKKTAAEVSTPFYHLLLCFATRDDEGTIKLLTQCFERRDDIGLLKGEIDGQQINRRVAELMVYTNLKPVLKMVVDAHATLSLELFDWAIMAAVLTRKPKEIYDLFSPYYLVKTNSKTKEGKTTSQRREFVREFLFVLTGRHRFMGHPYGNTNYSSCNLVIKGDEPGAKLDPRWLDAAIGADELALVEALARPKHKAAFAYLSRAVDEMLRKKETGYVTCLDVMIQIEHPQAVDYYIAALKQAGGNEPRFTTHWYLASLIQKLPKDAGPRIEELLPSLDEKVIDEIAPYLPELQAKS